MNELKHLEKQTPEWDHPYWTALGKMRWPIGKRQSQLYLRNTYFLSLTFNPEQSDVFDNTLNQTNNLSIEKGY